MTSLLHQLRERIDATPFVDTHEHLFDETTRLAGAHPMLGCNDWATMLGHYVCDDLASAGMAQEQRRRVFQAEGDAAAKAALLAPDWERVRLTGYGQALRIALKTLFGVDDLTVETAPVIAEQHADLMRPGVYERLLRGTCKIAHTQVNSLENPVFHHTDQPSLLRQDINITGLASPIANAEISARHGDRLTSLDAWLAFIDETFATCGPQAVAVKAQTAYARRLDFRPVDRRRAERLFPDAVAYQWAAPEDIVDIENFLTRYCLEAAARHGLPVKFHTGHYAGHGNLRLGRIRHNAADLCELAADFPDVMFVVFHTGYPYQAEMLSLAKQYPNVVVDMCWTWIIDPVAAVQFLKQFLVTVPSNKILTFGGDYFVVEPVIGHATIARRGIAQALAELVAEDWLAADDAFALIDPLMHGNATALFRTPPVPAAA